MRFPVISSFLFVLFFLVSSLAFGQKETAYWYFGSRAGLWFNPTAPQPVYLNNSKMKALEGCATISDSLGFLLFYTAGDTVFNRFHNKMNNGFPLSGHQSASQSSIIVEQPYTNLHYLFTVDALGGVNSLKYSVINQAANNYQGSVLAKNITVPGLGPQLPVSEKITAVDHGYTRDVWVITHGSGSQNDSFYAYKLTMAGIMPPVVSKVGISHAGSYPNYNTIGYMKASPDGRKLAVAIQELNLIEIYDFNDSTGVVSNPIRIPGMVRAYGLEFSRDCSKLYASVQGSTAEIFQFNLEAGAGHPDSIRNSRIRIGTTMSIYAAALQLANTGRIYVANTDIPPTNRLLTVINQPDSSARKVGFQMNFQALSPNPGSPIRSEHGLPNFNQSYLWLPSIRPKNLCIGEQTLFSIYRPRPFKSVLWNFGDSLSGAANISTSLNPIHQFTSSGTYQVTLTVVLMNNRTRSITLPVQISPMPVVNLGPDQEMCASGSKLVLSVPASTDKRLWSIGTDSSFATISRPGIYWIDVWNKNNCKTRDSIIIKAIPGPAIFSQKVVETCPFRLVKLSTSFKSATYKWSTGSTKPEIFVSREGYYKVTVQHRGCSFTDSVKVVFKDCPEDFEVPNVITPNGDQANDNFMLRGFLPGSFSLRIFNRWGNLIYETDSYKNDWPKQAPPAGVYYYQLQHLQTKQLYKGWVEVVH